MDAKWDCWTKDAKMESNCQIYIIGKIYWHILAHSIILVCKKYETNTLGTIVNL